MRLINKMLFGMVALVGATAATFPHGFDDIYLAGSTRDLEQREALKLCQAESPSFVAFLASDRSRCFQQMRPINMVAGFSGVWSKPDRRHMEVSLD